MQRATASVPLACLVLVSACGDDGAATRTTRVGTTASTAPPAAPADFPTILAARRILHDVERSLLR
ncbi:MAG: hypothetical protein M3P34_05855 [Actinomycetota bacterium]|nr:hypothetical protein [Actinomycetota bacterium]